MSAGTSQPPEVEPSRVSTATTQPPGSRRLTPALAALALATLAGCVAVAVAVMWPGLFTGHDTIVGNPGDPSEFIWSLAWAPFAIGHHLNPLLTDYLHYPGGANLMWNTTIVFPALVLSPITLLAGPIVAYNVLAVLGMSLSGWCAYLALRRWTSRWLSAAAGGLLYELSPFMVSQITGHAQLFIALFPPLLLLFADEILVRQRRPAWLLGALLGLAGACQLLTGSELLLICAVMSIPALISLAVIFRDRLRERLGFVIRAAEVAALTFVVLAAYPIYVQFLGPNTVHGVLQGAGFTARPTSFLIPSYLELFSGPSTVLDSSVYIGVPMLALAIGVTIRLRRNPVVVTAAVTAVCAMVLAMGGHLTVHSTATPIPLPWIALQYLPVFDNVLPTRIMVAGYLALAVLLAVFLDRVLAAPPLLRISGLAAAAVALVALIPSLPISTGQYDIPTFFTDGQAAQLGSGGSVLISPYGTTPFADYAPEVWQAVSGMAFKTQLGLVFTPGPGGHYWGPVLDALGTELHDLGNLDQPAPATLSASQRQTYEGDLEAHDVTAIVVGPSPGEAQVVSFVTELLGRPAPRQGAWWSGTGSTPQRWTPPPPPDPAGDRGRISHAACRSAPPSLSRGRLSDRLSAGRCHANPGHAAGDRPTGRRRRGRRRSVRDRRGTRRPAPGEGSTR